MGNDSSYHGYFGIREATANLLPAFCYMDDAKAVRSWLADEELPAEADESAEGQALQEPLSSLRNSMMKAVEVSHAQGELARLSANIGHALRESIIEREIRQRLEERDLVDSGEGWRIYRFEKSPETWLGKALRRLRRTDLGLVGLPGAALMSIVATFDSQLADTVRLLLSVRPDRLLASSKPVSLSDLMAASSLDDLRESAIEDEIYELFRGSHEDQVRFIESSFHIEIREKWKLWPDFIEVFERKNLVAHGEATFTSRYVDRCKKVGNKDAEELLDQPLALPGLYLFHALDTLLEFSFLVVFSFWRKHFRESEEDAYQSINNAIYRLLETGRYRVAARLAEEAKKLKGTKASDSIQRMLAVNLASAYHHLDEIENCEKVLNSLDWSATATTFKICVAALKGQNEVVLELMPRLLDEREAWAFNFRHWPVFDHLRKQSDFADKYEELFGEPLLLIQADYTQDDEHAEGG